MTVIRDFMKWATCVWYGTANSTPSSSGSISVANIPANFKWIAIGSVSILPSTNSTQVTVAITGGDTHYDKNTDVSTGSNQRVMGSGTTGSSTGTVTLTYTLAGATSGVADLKIFAVKALL